MLSQRRGDLLKYLQSFVGIADLFCKFLKTLRGKFRGYKT